MLSFTECNRARVTTVSLSVFFFAMLSANVRAGCMDTDNKLWVSSTERVTRDKLIQLMACPAEVDVDTSRQIDAVACNWFVAQAVNTLYGVTDFGQAQNGKWLTANEIASYVRSNKNWSKLGTANSQSVLNDAAAGAAGGQPVIAVTTGDPHGHVAVVLPGQPAPSTTWKDAAGMPLKAPNSAAFSLNNVKKAYVSCRLSAAFTDPSKVEIWWRLKVP